MKLYEALQTAKFDKRMIDWNMKQGLISEADLKKEMSTLPDLSSQCEQLTLEDEDEDEDGNSGYSHQ